MTIEGCQGINIIIMSVVKDATAVLRKVHRIITNVSSKKVIFTALWDVYSVTNMASTTPESQ